MKEGCFFYLGLGFGNGDEMEERDADMLNWTHVKF